jgi:homogentisate 1,2-dioxygenase
MQLQSPEARFFTIECPSQVEPPKRYRNAYGQLLEHAPYSERDIRLPQDLETHTERGEFEVRIKVRDRLTRHVLDHHPFDVVGWDGYLYPWIFNIADFEPITGRVHQPPPVHQTFEGHNFVVCSFVPRLFDYHPDGIPAPYNHSNVNSDEVIYYAEGQFMSRKGIDQYDISLHPYGLPHGRAGMTEASIGKRRHQSGGDGGHFSLASHQQAAALEKPEYMDTWLMAAANTFIHSTSGGSMDPQFERLTNNLTGEMKRSKFRGSHRRLPEGQSSLPPLGVPASRTR